jgi:hypothetical protein
MGLALLAASGATAALAQTAPAPGPEPSDAALAEATAPESGVISYSPADFAQFNPANALDMINRIPGFTFAAGEQVRGFQGAVGNVLIDGQRPSTKSVTLDNLLARIPSGAVQRIDLIRGGAAGIDMQGLPVVVNVVRRPGAGLTGAVDLGVKGYVDYPAGALGKLQLTRKSGGLTLDGTVNVELIPADSDPKQSGVGAGSLIRRDGFGRYTAFGRTALLIDAHLYQANATIEYRRPKDLFHLNLGLERLNQPRSEVSDLYTLAGAYLHEELRQKARDDKAEIGGDYERQLGRGVTVQFVALHTAKRNDLLSTFVTPRSATVSTRRGESGESIARTSIQGLTWRGVGFAAGIEGAYNTLDSRSGLVVDGLVQALPSANVRVTEKRAEGFVTLSKRPTADTSLELGIRVETSRIGQSGDVDRSRTFTFPKPRLIATWAPDKSSQLRFRVERVVGQLNFEDFAASGDLILGAAAGNADLQPERAWVFEGAVERRFWGQGAVILGYTHREIQQVNDRVAIVTPAGLFDAPGNIPAGTRDEIKATIALPLAKFGLKNTQIRHNLTTRGSRVVDPITGRARKIGGMQATLFDTTLIQDVPRWRSNFSLQSKIGYDLAAYRLVEQRHDRRPYALDFAWNWKVSPDWLVRVTIDNLLGKLIIRDRDNYAPTRAGVRVQEEDRRFIGHQVYTVRVRKTF